MNNQNGKGDSPRKGANPNAYWDNYDQIFRREKKTISQWSEHFGEVIKSHDGFRQYTESDLLTEEEYKKGLILCTRRLTVNP